MQKVTVIVIIVLMISLGSTLAQEDEEVETSFTTTCHFASLKCNYRTGCGNALKSYLVECNDLISNKTQVCSVRCRNTLIGLTSTPEGKRLMECTCEEDKECEKTKAAIAASCKDSVMRASLEDAVLTCSEARWICFADAECGKALDYYNLYCDSMFRGRRCSKRCKNSINILRRQRQAAKLETCQCQDNEYLNDEFRCDDVKRHLKDLCFAEENKKEEEDESNEVQDELNDVNEVDIDATDSTSGFIVIDLCLFIASLSVITVTVIL